MTRPKRPRDTNQLAKMIVRLTVGDKQGQVSGVNLTTNEGEQPEKNPAAVALGRRGGLKGGRARAEKLSPAQRKESARKAARARWKSRPR